MKCLSEELLLAYLDGECTNEEKEQVEQHIQDCSRCQTSLQDGEWEIELFKKALDTKPLPTPLDSSFVASVRQEIEKQSSHLTVTKEKKRNKWKKGFQIITATAATLALAIGIGVYSSPTFAAYLDQTLKIDMSKWFGLSHSDLEQIEHKEGFSATDKGITLEVNQVVADLSQVFFVYRLKGTDGKIIDPGELRSKTFHLVDQDGKLLAGYYEWRRVGRKTARVLFDQDQLPNELPEQFFLQIDAKRIGNVRGSWKIRVPIDYTKAKKNVQVFQLNQVYKQDGMQVDLQKVIYSPIDTRLVFQNGVTAAEKAKIEKQYPGEQARNFRNDLARIGIHYQVLDETGNLIASATPSLGPDQREKIKPQREARMSAGNFKGDLYFVYDPFPMKKKFYFVLDEIVRTVLSGKELTLHPNDPTETTKIGGSTFTVQKLDLGNVTSPNPIYYANMTVVEDFMTDSFFEESRFPIQAVAVDEKSHLYDIFFDPDVTANKNQKIYKMHITGLKHKPEKLTIKLTTEKVYKVSNFKIELPGPARE